jgi:hypothetical protein
VTNFHHRGQASDPLTAVEQFVAKCRCPAVLEEGEAPIALTPGQYVLGMRGGRLRIEAADETRVLARTLLAVRTSKPGILDCTFARFGGGEGKLSFLDLDRPQTAHRRLTANRQSFGEQFRRMLRRQYPGWELKALTSGMDLRRSFSPVFPRAMLERGQQIVGAMACPKAENESDFLTFALLWFDHLRSPFTSLSLFLPEGAGCLTAQRLRWLRSDALRTKLLLFNEHGAAGEVDPADLGNLDTRVASRYLPPVLAPAVRELLEKLLAIPNVSAVPDLGGSVGIRSKGIEFARLEGESVRLGLNEKTGVAARDWDSVIRFALDLSEVAGVQAAPERWLEGAVREHLEAVDPFLVRERVHGQVLTFAGSERSAVDLLAVSQSGRLSVLELKAGEDLQLPLQALDYWMRARWHLERGELDHLFPGQILEQKAPKLMLVAPALGFHSTTETLLRYFSPAVEVERVGVSSDWFRRFRVVLRLTGADTPMSHGRREWPSKA